MPKVKKFPDAKKLPGLFISRNLTSISLILESR